MNICIYGDSYAPKMAKSTVWWKVLRKFGHTTTCFGDPGSSILFSVNLIKQYALNFDFNIWCLTCPGRFSVKINEEWFHTNGLYDVFQPNKQVVVDAVRSYQKYLIDYHSEILVSNAIVEYVLNHFQNLMIIPCFDRPLYDDTNTGFNLFEVSRREANKYYPEIELKTLYEQYHDKRQAHLSMANNEILANLVSMNLVAGIFSTEYNNFVEPSESIEEMFERK